MSYIFLPPEDDVALFTKGKPKKPKGPLPWWLELPLVFYASGIFLSFGYVAAQFGIIAFQHHGDRQAPAGMIVALVLGTFSVVAGAVAGKTGLSLLGMS